MRLREDTKNWLMLLFAFVVGALLAMLVLANTAGAAQEVCPEEGKVESVVDGDLDDIVLDAGTQVCIKGGQVLVNVTADGTSTLAELLGTGQNVSHYTITEVPPSTTTTIPEETTTTVESSTTTTLSPTTTTSVTEATTTVPSTTTTTPAASSTTEPVEESTTTSESQPPTSTLESEELPYTGVGEIIGLIFVAMGLITLGVTALKAGSLDHSDD